MYLPSISILGFLATISTVTAEDLFWAPLPQDASAGALKYQPAVDYDETACYQTAAIDKNGHTNSGLELSDRSCRQWDGRLRSRCIGCRHAGDGWSGHGSRHPQGEA